MRLFPGGGGVIGRGRGRLTTCWPPSLCAALDLALLFFCGRIYGCASAADVQPSFVRFFFLFFCFFYKMVCALSPI